MSNPFMFISYSTQDNDFAQQLTGDLQSAGIEVWIDKHGLKAGTPDWENAIREAIRDAGAILLVASPNSRESRYVRDELLIAEMYKRNVIAIWAQGENWPECIRMGYIGTQYADARGSKYQSGLLETINALRSLRSMSAIEEKPLTNIPPHNFKFRNPYKGLRAFTGEDKRDFFGRKKLVDELVEAIKENTDSSRFLAVVGSSGSGKSSVVMAGLLPRLQSGVLNGSDKWIYVEPVLPGSQPLESLAAVMANALNLTISLIVDELNRNSRCLVLLAKQLTKGQRNSRVVLLIDQFEELFTQTSDEDKRNHFLDLIVTAATELSGQMIVLITLRADFYDRTMKYPELGKLLEKHTKNVFQMNLEDLREVIEKPAALPDVQLKFENGLVGDLLFEVRGQAGALPLLQFMLDQLVENHKENVLTDAVYHELGGVKGALARHAEATYQKLPSDQHREVTRFLFLRLIEPGLNEYDTTRRRAIQNDLTTSNSRTAATLQQVLIAFSDSRLLILSNVHGVPTVEISHETLISEWKRLAEWVEKAREDIKLQNAINFDTRQWVIHNRRIDDLYRGEKLKEAREWLKRNSPTADENDFILAGIKEEEKHVIGQNLLSLDEEKKQQVINNSRDLMASLDGAFKFVYINNAIEGICRYSSDELVGYSMMELIHSDDIEMVQNKILNLSNKKNYDTAEFRFRHRDGYHIWLEGIFSSYFDANDTFLGWVVTAREVSERRWMTRAMLEQEKLLVMLQKEQEFASFRLLLAEEIKAKLLPSLQIILNSTNYFLNSIKDNGKDNIIAQIAAIERETLQLQSVLQLIITRLTSEFEDDELNS